MSYYTHYHLEVMKRDERHGFYEPEESVIDEIKRVFIEIMGGEAWASCEFDEMFEGTAELKWYDNGKDMKELAKAFPDIYFTLEGEGEDRGDYWIKQFHGDEYHESYAEIIEPERRW